MQIHHVQVSCAPGGEDAQRRFYGDALGITEVPKPATLAGRGGCWFRGEGAEVHVGVEADFAPQRKAHPAFVLADRAALDAQAQSVTRAGFDVDWTERDTFPGMYRFHTRDGAGNRVEILAPTEPGDRR